MLTMRAAPRAAPLHLSTWQRQPSRPRRQHYSHVEAAGCRQEASHPLSSSRRCIITYAATGPSSSSQGSGIQGWLSKLPSFGSRPSQGSPSSSSTSTTQTAARPSAAASPPVQDLSKQELEAALKYGTLASCAYLDKEADVASRLAAFNTGELKGVPFKLFIATGTLWSSPLSSIKTTTDTEVLCVRMPDKDGKTEMAIAFRGTETSGMGASSDVFTDLFALQSHISDMKGVPKDRHPQSVKVHRGFLKSFNDVVQQTNDGTFDAMSSVRDELFGKGVLPDKVVVCGHSLGAALATLGAFWVKSVMPSADVECYAFASPRVGTQGFVDAFKTAVDKCRRFTHKNDVVCAVPASSTWSHVDRSVLLLEPAKNTYGHTLAPQAAASTYRAVLADRPRNGVYASVSHHSMDLYLEAVKDALKVAKA